jgi:hypothetical protein
MAVVPLDGLEGAADIGSYEAQWQARRRPIPARSTVATAPGAWFLRAGAAAMPLTVAGMASHRPSAFT